MRRFDPGDFRAEIGAENLRFPVWGAGVTPLAFGAVWVLAATAVAFLPMRRQFAPGLVLLAAAPLLLIWIGLVHGWLWVGFGLFAFLSMFRRPLLYFARRAVRQTAGLPPEMRE